MAAKNDDFAHYTSTAWPLVPHLLNNPQDGLLNKTELSQRKQRLELERQTIAERSEQIQRQQKQQSVKAQIIGEFSAFCASAQKALENPTPEVKQEVLRLLVESIVVEDNAITIKHTIPADDNSRLLPRGIMQKHPRCRGTPCTQTGRHQTKVQRA